MKTLFFAAIRWSLMFTAVAALLVAYPASVQAVPTTYQYTGNPFTFVFGAYTTSDFVSGMVTLASPLAANMPLTAVTPLAFSFSDGVQTITGPSTLSFSFFFATDGDGTIIRWNFAVSTTQGLIQSKRSFFGSRPVDVGRMGPFSAGKFGLRDFAPGSWTTTVTAPDAGSSLALLSLSLTALGVVARRFQGAAA